MNPISLASGVLPEFGPVETAKAAISSGFDGVGLWVEPEQWTRAMTTELKAMLDGSGIALIDVEVVWIKPGSEIDTFRRIIDVGAELGARNVLCVSSDPDHGATADTLAELCRHAEPTGIRVALEFGIFTEVRNLRQAMAILDSVAHPLRAVLIDPIHVDRSGTSVFEIAAVPEALLPYAQFCDASAIRPDPEQMDEVITDAIDLREQCGRGALDLKSLYNVLPVGIPLSIELRSKRLRDDFPDPAARASIVAQATRRWLRSVQTDR